MKKLFMLLAMAMVVFFSFPINAISQCPEEIYSGTYSGDDTGVWLMILDSGVGSIAIVSDSSNYPLIFNVKKGVGDDGIIITCEFGTATIISGIVSGTWNYDGGEGTLNGSKPVNRDVSEFAGKYSGTFDGDGDNGTWSATIDSNGSITASIYSTIYADDSGSGTVCSSGYFEISAGGGGEFAGMVDSNWKVVGIWVNENLLGVIRGSKEVPPGSGDSGGGGCFISSTIYK